MFLPDPTGLIALVVLTLLAGVGLGGAALERARPRRPLGAVVRPRSRACSG